MKLPRDLTPYDPKLPYWLVPPQTNVQNTPPPPPPAPFGKPNNRPGTKYTRRLIWMLNSGRYKLGEEENNKKLAKEYDAVSYTHLTLPTIYSV